MASYYVETYRPAYPQRGVRVKVHKARNFGVDQLSPDMTTVYLVEYVTTKEEAIACVLERAAGHNTCVRLVHGKLASALA